ncbi:MAG: hypothetical protein JWP61_2948 [Friedmanniella sp.]|nr:hypothetical protein [Friedmanniella sp.]
MFVQVIKGKVNDASAVRGSLETWARDLAPGAEGWLGSTTGVTDDGTLIAVARFDTEEHARRNSDRPEQGQWWAATERLFDGDVTFEESTEVDDFVVGDPDSAGFVQVMQGQVTDPVRSRELMRQRPADFRQLRPDILAILGLAHQDGRWTSVAYFTSEAEARQHESQEPPAEFVEMMKQMTAISVGPPTFHDLRQVWFQSPDSARKGAMADH